MSYCVNCGVQLEESEKNCPLCGTEVLNPRKPYKEGVVKNYPAQMDDFTPRENTAFNVSVISIVFSIIASVCLACDMAYTNAVGWSVIVSGAIGMLWVFVATALVVKKQRIFIIGTIDALALLGFLWVVQQYSNTQWFSDVAIPAIAVAIILYLLDAVIVKFFVERKLNRMAVVICSIAMWVVAFEMVLNRYAQRNLRPNWSIAVGVACLVLSALFMVIDRRKRWKDEMRKRLHM